MKVVNSIKNVMAVLLMALAITSCQSNEKGEINLPLPEPKPDPVPEAAFVFNHPCALYTGEDFARVRKSLEDGTASQPVKDEFKALQQNNYTNGNYGVVTHEHQQIVRGDAKGTIEGSENYGDAMRDAAAAHQFGMLWQLTGNEEYAQKGITILNAWAGKCTAVTSNDSNHKLAAGCQGFTFALAGELLRDYKGWTESKFIIYKRWMVSVFATKNLEFLEKHQNTNCGAKHYWSNWDLVNLCSYLQIGILTEDEKIVNYVIEYFMKSGIGTGALNNLVLAEHNDPLGSGEKICQAQESGRDQGHAHMAAMVAGQLAQCAWALYQSNPTKNLDFYGAKDNALLKMFEYVALTNLRNGTDNSNATGTWLISAAEINAKAWTAVGPWCSGGDNHEACHVHTQFADDSGRGNVRPGWECIYQHYKAQGVTSTKYVKMFADKLRPECGVGDSRYGGNSGAFDQIGWGTLMSYK